jgi:hypothetical protein
MPASSSATSPGTPAPACLSLAKPELGSLTTMAPSTRRSPGPRSRSRQRWQPISWRQYRRLEPSSRARDHQDSDSWPRRRPAHWRSRRRSGPACRVVPSRPRPSGRPRGRRRPASGGGGVPSTWGWKPRDAGGLGPPAEGEVEGVVAEAAAAVPRATAPTCRPGDAGAAAAGSGQGRGRSEGRTALVADYERLGAVLAAGRAGRGRAFGLQISWSGQRPAQLHLVGRPSGSSASATPGQVQAMD